MGWRRTLEFGLGGLDVLLEPLLDDELARQRLRREAPEVVACRAPVRSRIAQESVAVMIDVPDPILSFSI
jgi:hypothetical protein